MGSFNFVFVVSLDKPQQNGHFADQLRRHDVHMTSLEQYIWEHLGSSFIFVFFIQHDQHVKNILIRDGII